MSSFVDKLKNVISDNFYNVYPGMSETPRDFDAFRKKDMSLVKKIRIALRLKKINFEKIFEEVTKNVSIKDLEKTYNLLSDDYSKKLFIDLVSLRIIGNRMSLDIEKEKIWDVLKKIERDMQWSCPRFAVHIKRLRTGLI